MQVQHNSEIQPTLSRPDIADVTSPFLVRGFRHEITIQHIGRDVEAVVAICRCLVFTGSDHFEAVLAHQTTDTAVTNIQADLLQFFRYAGAAIAAKAQTMLLANVSQQHQIITLTPDLSGAHRTPTPGTVST
jgi:hypothetical protein